MTDTELVRQALDGHQAAQDQLVRRWAPRVLAVCHARVGRRCAAEDLAQETLLRGLTHLKTLQQPDKVGPWLRGIASRVCLDWLRSRSREQTSLGRVQADLVQNTVRGDAEVGRIEHDESRERLLAEVDALPDELREPLLLFYYDDVTYEQIAQILEVSRATVNARLAKARSLLAKRLAGLMR